MWYASTKERAAWAEHFRHHPRGGVDPFEARRRVGRACLEDLRLLDLTDEEVREVLGVTADDLTGEDYARCHDIADRARATGFDGISAPSAAFRGEFTVVVFTHAMHKVVEEHSRIQRPPRTMRKYLRQIPRRKA